MNISVGIEEASNRLLELIQAVEDGKVIVITRNGRPVAQLGPPRIELRRARFDGMKGKIRLLPGWDDPITEAELLGEDD